MGADGAGSRFPKDKQYETANIIRRLIADDNPATRALLQTSTYQAAIWEAADGEEAIHLAESVQPDVILMDGQMPKLDDIQATQRIKNCWPTIKVIILTMYMRYQSALAAGADAFLLKEGPADELITAVFGYLISQSARCAFSDSACKH